MVKLVYYVLSQHAFQGGFGLGERRENRMVARTGETSSNGRHLRDVSIVWGYSGQEHIFLS